MSFSVKEIAKTLRDNKKQGTPVIVFTGAGCSKSAGMPLASELINEMNKKYKSNLKTLTDTEKKDYGLCMRKLTPHEQKSLIEKHISKAKINWAHIALASLLKNGYLGKVLTFNFDNILNRACSLDNFYPPTYDLKVLSEEYFSAIPNQSIVHLHGQWSGFQLANSDIDTKNQANKLKVFIQNTINNSPTLFIGYSGGADAFFKLVDEGFIGQHRLFWIDYAKEPNNNVKQFLDVNPNHRNFIGEQDADRFLLELAIELKCFPTELFKDPIKHLKGICELVNQFPLPTSDTEVDILEDTKKTLAIVDTNKPAITTIKLAELLHAKKFETIINQVKNLDIEIKPISKIVASAYLGKSLSFIDKDESQFIINFDEAIKLEPKFYQAYAQVATALTHTFKENYLEQSLQYYEKSLYLNPNWNNEIFFANYGLALYKVGDFKQDETLFKSAFEQFEKALKVQPNHSNYLTSYGNALSKLGMIKNDEILFNKSFEKYEKALSIQPNQVSHLGNYGNALSDLAKIKEDEVLFNKSFEQYEKALNIQPDQVSNLGNYANALSDLARIKEDDSLFAKAFVQYESALKIQPEHVNHLGNYGNALSDLARIKEDEILFNKAFEQFEKALKIKPDDFNSLNNYGVALSNLAIIKQDKVLLDKAFKHFKKALEIKPNETYNIACYYSVTKNLELCKENLLKAEKNSTLPINPYKQLNEDKDLENARSESWFIELLERLKSKDENLDKVS